MNPYTGAIVHGRPQPHACSRRPRLLVVGCGDVGLRVLKQLSKAWRVFALTSSPARIGELRAAGATPITADLDRPETLFRVASLAPWVLHLAPPPNHGAGQNDPRTKALLQALARGGVVRRLVYASTTGVYGDARGETVDELRPVAPTTARARRRVDAEMNLRRHGRVHGVCVTVLRVPGIYAMDRVGGNPIDRVRQAAPVLVREDDVYTNRIHADDLARACMAALMRGRPQRVVQVCDGNQMLMGDAMDQVADRAGLPRPPRITRDEARASLSPMSMSFLSESRRLTNQRMLRELRVRLKFPSLDEALIQHLAG